MKRTKAFTLVELLVVIGIIALLISILLPSLNRVRQQANSLKCLSNLRQFGTLVQLYAQSHKGSLPIGSWNGSSPLSSTTFAARQTDWTFLLEALIRRDGNSITSVARSAKSTSRNVFIDTDTIAAPDPFDSKGADLTHYSCHPILMPTLESKINGTVYLKPYKLGSIQRSSEIVLIFDGVQVTGDNSVPPYVGGAWRAVSVAYRIDSDYSYANPTRFQGKPFLNYYSPTADNSSSVNGQTNKDVATYSSGTGDGGIRWRHMKNTTANFLFVDGHCEGKRILNAKDGGHTELLRSNVNVNPPSTDATFSQ
ncbi:MAG: hypothetical protein JWM57_286 [Phycisphaerales bacterium]|nr:hypothetical protein [Phycisphaerales bacterium]